MKELIVSEERLAKHWKMTPRRVRQYADEGVAVRVDGGYNLLESDLRLIDWLRRDEPTARAKRELLKAKLLESERRLEERDRQWLTLAEVRTLIDGAWAALRQAHQASQAHLYGFLARRLGDEVADGELLRVGTLVTAETRLAKERLEALYGGALETMNGDLRCGILSTSRRIRALHAALGEDDSAEARDNRERIGGRHG